ncbi:MAG TPA: hypothetical protein VF277_03500 [Steroidobacteraceae bacterium]
MLIQLRRVTAALALCVPLVAFAQDPVPAAPAPEVAPAAMAAPATETAAAPAAMPAPEAAPAPAVAPVADANTGTVVFFREKKFAGSMVRYKVREAGKELGKLSSGTYFTVPLSAGKHVFEVHSEAKDVLNIEVEPGETYYVVGTVTMGVMAGHPNLSPSDQATFEKAKASLKDVTGQDIGDGSD